MSTPPDIPPHLLRRRGPKQGDAIDQRVRVPAPFATFKVDTTSPFKVFLNGATVSVPGQKVVGATYSVGTTGIAFVVQGQQPVCLPTV